MKCVGRRVDGLVLAYRVSLDSAFVDALRECSKIARKHGRAGFEWKNRVPVGAAAQGSRELVRLGGLRARWGDETTGPTEYVRGMWGELRFSDRDAVWHLTNQPYFRMQIKMHAPGAVDRLDDRTGAHVSEGGWTVEIIFYAQWLADVGLDAAIREGEALAQLCGEVHESRVRRIDVCADIMGWAIRERDVKRLVKRPRARWQKEYGDVGVGKDGMLAELAADKRDKSDRRATTKEKQEGARAQDFGRGALDRRQITGVSVGRGGAMMSRIYDKRAELERDEPRRLNEERRWTHAAGCPDLARPDLELRAIDEARGECPHCRRWDGVTRVTRVEFQLRGPVIKELGLLNPEVALDVIMGDVIDGRGRMRRCVVGHKPMATSDGVVLGLADRLDWLWRTCLEWVRIIKPERTISGKLKPIGRLEEDDRWAFLRTVTFDEARGAHPIKRFRVRAAASAAMGLGVALAQAGRDGELRRLPTHSGAYDEETAEVELHARVAQLKADEARKIVAVLLTKYGGAIGACVHFAVRNNAALLRFKERSPGDAAYSTGPPDGDGPRPSPLASQGRHDATGGREESRAVA